MLSFQGREAGWGDVLALFAMIAGRGGCRYRKTDGMRVRDKELKVNRAAYGRNQVRRLVERGSVVGRPVSQVVPLKRSDKDFSKHKVSQSQHFSNRTSYAKIVRRGSDLREALPVVKGASIGNGWLHRSASYSNTREHRTIDVLLENFLHQDSSNPLVRRMENKQVLLTFQSEELRNKCIDDHNQNGSQWFTSISPWDVNSGRSFGREIWLSCYGIQFKYILRCWATLGRVINNQMKLVVGFKSFVIRVAEEQAVFISNSNFQCECRCHVAEYPRAASDRGVIVGKRFQRSTSSRVYGKQFEFGIDGVHNDDGAKSHSDRHSNDTRGLSNVVTNVDHSKIDRDTECGGIPKSLLDRRTSGVGAPALHVRSSHVEVEAPSMEVFKSGDLGSHDLSRPYDLGSPIVLISIRPYMEGSSRDIIGLASP
ncbi:hypothetical protein Dimus_036025 [Dionaea muscipula]